MTRLTDLRAKSPTPAFPHGELLTEHLRDTLDASTALAERIGRVDVLPDRFWTWVRLAALLHDAGKVPSGFQTMVSGGPNWGERHEAYSLAFVASLLADLPGDDRAWVGLGVLTHHRPLTNASPRSLFFQYGEENPESFATRFGPVDTDAASELLGWLADTANAEQLLHRPADLLEADLAAQAWCLFMQLLERWGFSVDIATGRTAVLLQGAVTLADHLSSAHGGLHIRQPIDQPYAKALVAGKTPYPHQNDAATVNGHLLLRAPTGKGKTEAALMWAATQVDALRSECGGWPRVFYTLPYLASINAMTGRLERHLPEDMIGVAHSRAASYHLSRSACPDGADEESLEQAAKKAVSRAAATRLFREPVRVGTPYQLLRGALAGPAHSGILIDSANSVFILDELHAYDADRLGMILAMMRFWEDLGGRIGVISATLPDRLLKLLDDTLQRDLHIVEALDEQWPIRHHLTIREQHLAAPESLEEITGRLRSGQAVLVVANNVADARAIFETVGPIAASLHGDDAAILLHSQFRTGDRSIIEDRIRTRYGVDAPRRQAGLVVATQVVEVSLDVDFDALHTSGAPLEALLQRFGRVNRVGERPAADVVVHQPDYRARRGESLLRADGIYDDEPTRLTMNILMLSNDSDLNEHDTGEWLNEVYASGWGKQWHADVIRMRDAFGEAFLDFVMPFDDRSHLTEQFDAMFDGVDAILESDLAGYVDALESVDGRAGRLLGSEFLVPLPHHGRRFGRYDEKLKVVIVDADYDPVSGLGQIRGYEGPKYEMGEVL